MLLQLASLLRVTVALWFIRPLVMLSEEDYNAIQETFYLSANPKLKASIIEGLNTPLSECSDKIEW